MLNVLADMLAIEWAAKSLHYRANGEQFYGLHLLADKVDFGSAADDLKEAYYLGFQNTIPPDELEIVKHAVELATKTDYSDNRTLLIALKAMCELGITFVEDAKREAGLPGGVHSILDGISQTMLTIRGLCWRSFKDTEVVELK